MKIEKKYIILFFGLALFGEIAVTSYAQEEYSRERYQLIVDRAPFGAAAEEIILPGGVANPEVVQDLQEQVRLNFLLQSEDEGTIKAGFQVLRPVAGQPKSFVLEEGENYQQIRIKLISVDLENSIANVEYNGLSVPLELGATPANAGRNVRGRTTTTSVAGITRPTGTAATSVTRRFENGFQPTMTGNTAQPPIPTTTTTTGQPPMPGGMEGGFPGMEGGFPGTEGGFPGMEGGFQGMGGGMGGQGGRRGR
ncbi:MAG: hypothetical protein JXR23_08175 [Pontiellaceae bacterium]|nr:hypothetical protein [Pontiellaceae bacterium]